MTGKTLEIGVFIRAPACGEDPGLAVPWARYAAPRSRSKSCASRPERDVGFYFLLGVLFLLRTLRKIAIGPAGQPAAGAMLASELAA